MPRSPQYRPEFSLADLEKARDLIRRTSSRQDYVLRARIALLIAEEPLISNVEAARQIGVHEQTIRYWRKVWCREGFRVEIGKGRGQKPRFPPWGAGEAPGGGEGGGV